MFVSVESLLVRGRLCGVGVLQGFARHDTIFTVNRVGAPVIINIDMPVLGSLLILICRVCLSLIRHWSMVGMLTST